MAHYLFYKKVKRVIYYLRADCESLSVNEFEAGVFDDDDLVWCNEAGLRYVEKQTWRGDCSKAARA